MILQSPKFKTNGYLLSFIFCALSSFVMFLPFLIMDQGFFLFAGDFNSQQIPFYTYATDFIDNQLGHFSWQSDLGGSFINTFAFYLLGSPFFWLSSIFPASWQAYLMVPILIIKFGVMGIGAFAYLKRYTKTQNIAIIGACLYALSGFNVYNIFFNHFVDCAALFPFMLAALDAYVLDGKKAFFAFTVAINCLNNYFFFAGQILFLFIYFIFKIITKEYKITFKNFALLAFESLLGVAMGCLLLIPAALSLQNNPRTSEISSGFSLIMYYSVQQYFAVFSSIFMPPDPAYLPSIYTEGNIKWTSMSAFLPVVSASGVIAFLCAKKKSAFTKILWLCFFMAMVPALNSAFYMLNSSYYARWFYMPILIMCAVTLPVIEEQAKEKDENSKEFNIESALKKTFIFTAVFSVFGLIPTKIDGEWQIGTANEPEQFWLLWLTAMFGIGLFYCIIRFKGGKKSFVNALLITILIYSSFYGGMHIALGKFPQIDNDANYRQETYVSAIELEFPYDEQFFRTDSYKTHDNIGLWANTGNLQFFNSVVTPSIMEFYPSVDVKRDVSSKPEHDIYALRGLLGVKYTIVPKHESDSFEENYLQYGHEFAFENDDYKIYENTNYYGMGFAYEKYISLTDLESIAVESRAEILVRAIGLDEEQIAKYSSILQPLLPDEQMDLTYEHYVQDIENIRAKAVQDFNATSDGFTANITLEDTSLVFFAVPFETGFTAIVNGNEVQIEKVSNGLMAIQCEAGYNEIVFTYVTPGFNIALLITIIALIIFGIYIILIKKQRNGASK